MRYHTINNTVAVHVSFFLSSSQYPTAAKWEEIL